jgi:hypothetical protein
MHVEMHACIYMYECIYVLYMHEYILYVCACKCVTYMYMHCVCTRAKFPCLLCVLCVWGFMCMHAYLRTCVSISVYALIHVWLCMYACVHIGVFIYVCVCTLECMCVYQHACTNVSAYLYILHKCMYVRT